MVARTSSKELLISSALQLLSKYPIERITVSMIAENCSLSKRTFYYHFSDKYDIANKAYYYHLLTYCDENTGSVSLHGFLTHIAEFIHAHRSFFVHMAKYKGQNNIKDFNIVHMRKLFIRIINETYHETVSNDLFQIITFYITGITCYMINYLSNKPDASPNEIIKLFETCMPSPLQKYLA